MEANLAQEVRGALASTTTSVTRRMCDREIAAALADGLQSNQVEAHALQGVARWLEPYLSSLRRLSERYPSGGNALLGDGLRRIAMARADDAWGCLERSEALLGGRTRSPLWWSRLGAMQLHVLATSAAIANVSQQKPVFRPLTYRARQHIHDRIVSLWREGRDAATGDSYNRLRMLDYFARALAANRGASGAIHAEMTQELQELGEVYRNHGELFVRYYMNVQIRTAMATAPLPFRT